MQSKHDGVPFDPTACENSHLIHGGSTKGSCFLLCTLRVNENLFRSTPFNAVGETGVAVHGTLRKAKMNAKVKKASNDD